MTWKDKHGRPEPFVHPDIKSGKADGKAHVRTVGEDAEEVPADNAAKAQADQE